jgi:hypothetical protein
MSDQPIIPVKVRTARKRHRCDHYLCGGWIEPGDQYEDHRLPPGRDDVGNTRWIKHRVHFPSWPGSGYDGCVLAGAYQEHAARMTRQVITA